MRHPHRRGGHAGHKTKPITTVRRLLRDQMDDAIEADHVFALMPMVPWRQVIGLRNILAHGYEQVEHETLFNTIARELPQLEETLKQELQRYQQL